MCPLAGAPSSRFADSGLSVLDADPVVVVALGLLPGMCPPFCKIKRAAADAIKSPTHLRSLVCPSMMTSLLICARYKRELQRLKDHLAAKEKELRSKQIMLDQVHIGPPPCVF